MALPQPMIDLANGTTVVEADLDAYRLNILDLDSRMVTQEAPAQGKRWRTAGFQTLTNTMVDVTMQSSRVSGGIASTTNGIQLNTDGFYDIRMTTYLSGGSAYHYTMNITRRRSATADLAIVWVQSYKADGGDYVFGVSDILPLKAGDELVMRGDSVGGVGSTWGTSEANGVRFQAIYHRPLAGATPV